MGKRKHKRESTALYASLAQQAHSTAKRVDRAAAGHEDAPLPVAVLAASPELAPLLQTEGIRGELPRMKKFRFQLLHAWLVAHFEPCRMADVGGGKGLLAYLLQGSGWSATVIDPSPQTLPARYKDIQANRPIRLPPTATISRLNHAFTAAMAQEFDVLVALHAHGCNIQLLEAAARFGRHAVLLPCCIIQEPILPLPGVHWLQAVVDYALGLGLAVEPFRLNFKGQNIGLWARPAG